MLGIIALASMITLSIITTSSSPKPEYTIVIDAGHGGRDGGTVGKTTGISESELNLQDDIDEMLQKRYDKFRKIGVFQEINQI